MAIYRLNQKVSGSSGTGTTDYAGLSNKPQINSVTLTGDKSGTDLGLVEVSQGVSESGKFLGIGSDGNVTPVNAPTASAVWGSITGTLSDQSDLNTALGGKQNTAVTSTGTLTAAGWSNSTQTVNVAGVTASNIVIVTPAPASFAAWVDKGVYCSAQGAGTLTFTCSATPTADLTANVVIL